MTDLEKLQNLCKEIDDLERMRVTCENPAFEKWRYKTERFLIKKYGKESDEFNRFNNISFSLWVVTSITTESAYINACLNGLKDAKTILSVLIEEMEEDNMDSANLINNSVLAKITDSDFSSVFIVHGHNGELKQYIARLLEHQEIKPIILSEQANNGMKTVIEKFEDNSNVPAAICLFTADDFGKTKDDKTDYRYRARQNVVLETGYFMGKLGRDNVILIADHSVEMPSDLGGVMYSDNKDLEKNILRELKNMGFKIDMNKLL